MGPELIAAVIGPLAGATIGALGFMSRRNMISTDSHLKAIAESVEVISHQVTNLQIQIPTNYATKEELTQHIQSEESWHTEMMRELRELREEVIVLRVNMPHRNNQ